MRFANPEFLWLIAALPLLVAALDWARRRRLAAAERYASAHLLPFLAPGLAGRSQFLRPALVLAACALLVVAGARPQWGYEDRKLVNRGLDLMVALDASRSMLAVDMQPSRLQRARELLQNVIWKARGDRLGVIAFAGSAYVMCPLTLDYSVAQTALQAIGPTTVQRQGTDIGKAIDTAIRAFEFSPGAERVLVLLTDGEDQGTTLEAAVQRAVDANVRIYPIGIGSTEGSPIPLPDGNYKSDRQGRVVNTRLDMGALESIAKRTGGQAIVARERGASELDPIFEDIDRMQTAEFDDRVYRVYHDRSMWFLVPALALFCLEGLIPGTRGGRRTRRSLLVGSGNGAAAVAALILLPGIAAAYPFEASVESQRAAQLYSEQKFDEAAQTFERAAQRKPGSPVLKYGLGTSLLQAGERQKAIETFQNLYDSASPRVSSSARYNEAIAHHRTAREAMERLATDAADRKAAETARNEAIESLRKSLANYREAMLLNPTDSDLKYNYMVAMRELEQLLQQPPEAEGSSGNEGEEPPPEGDESEDQQDNQQNDGDDPKEQQKDQESPGSDSPQQNDPQQQSPEQPGEGQQNTSGEEQKDEQRKDEPQDQGPQQPARPQPGQGQPQEMEIDEMTPQDVERLLNTLPEENRRALMNFLGSSPDSGEDMENDW